MGGVERPGLPADGPLRGVRVLDACDDLALYASKLLVNLGAEVVRPEPVDGDPMRRYPPFAGDVSLYWEHFNAGKRSVTLDPVDEARLERLVASCHAIIESGDVPSLLSSRVGVARLRGWRPDLVLVSVTPFGLSGPRRDWAGSDLVVAAESGLLALNGRPDAAPYRPGGEQAAHMAGLIAANAALLGIFAQQRGGGGCHVEVPAAHAATLATLQTANANYLTWQGKVPKRRGIGLLPAYRSLFEANDGWIILVVLPGQWDNCLRLLAAHDALDDLADARYQDADLRVAEAEHINTVIGAFSRRFGKQYLFEAAQQAGLAVTPVNNTADILADPFLARRGFFRTITQPTLGPLPYAGPPVRFAGRTIGTQSPAPALGQDDQAIWADELGLPVAAVATPRQTVAR
jgi:crotonobetainyl-CoA:carnitine CoA-transferase CaiB-like acyl-CoA transferase